MQDLLPIGGSAVIYAPPKAGKALDIATPILTPGGWRTMADLQPGDLVYGTQGHPIRVTATSDVQYERPCYAVAFADGSHIIADAEHLWTVEECSDHPTHTHVLTTFDMLQRGVRVSTRRGAKTRFRVRLAAPLEFSVPMAPLPLDPYLLGTWLGDGTSREGAITTADAFIVQAWRDAGWTVTKRRAQYSYGILGLAGVLNQLQVRANKHIPAMYLTASVADRLALLQGLFDTDGGAEPTATFSNCNVALADQVYDLAVSLGYKVKRSVRRAKIYGKDCGPCVVLRIRGLQNPFRLPRKVAKFRPSTEHYWPIVSITPVPTRPVKCITVDAPDRCFLVGRACIPTHNSWTALGMALAVSEGLPDFLGHSIHAHGKVLYCQFDVTYALTANDYIEPTQQVGFGFDGIYWTGRDIFPHAPFNILDPEHRKWLKGEITSISPSIVVYDTIRDIHGGDENDSGTMRNVIAYLRAVTEPSAMLLLAHSRKPLQGVEEDSSPTSALRGSSVLAGAVDCIMQLTKTKLKYVGRGAEGSDPIKRAYPTTPKPSCGLWMRDEDLEATALRQAKRQVPDASDRELAREAAKLLGRTKDNEVEALRAKWKRMKDTLDIPVAG